jgi:glycosyltransferase involved in cell wall biosynthesis
MKILWFSNTPALGLDVINKNKKISSTGGWLYALNENLQEYIDLSIAFHYPHKLSFFEYQKTKYFPIFNGNILLESLKKRFKKSVSDNRFLSNYLKIIELVQPDLIHIHGTENSFLCILDKVKIPIVVSIQGNLTVIHHKYFSGFHGKFLNEKGLKFSFKEFILGRYSFAIYFSNLKKMARVEQENLKKVKHIIGRTDWDRRVTRILANKSIYYCGEEILRNGFYHNKWDKKISTNKYILFTTLGNSYIKGLETLCHALYILNDTGLNVEWHIAGVSSNSLINHITKKHLGATYPQKGLFFYGSLDEVKLIEVLKLCDIYVMTSHIENSSNSLCEALILGVPSIASFVGGTSSLIKDGEDGVLVQDGDPWSLAGAIIELLNNPNLLSEISKKARERALIRHDKKNIVNQYLENYKKIIKHN